ncbi:Nn.00g021710.m01.CDS01 [Neocucurbitaria sp. VM-36]
MTAGSGTSHHPIPRQPGSSENVGPFVDVVTWILLITSALAVLTRLITKRALSRRIDVDDAFVIAALITSIGSGISVSVQTANGLGRDISSLADNQIVAYQKSEYANKLLYIATLAFAKLSIISLLMILTASDLHRNLGIGLTGFIALWGIASEFVTAFQCGTVEPWRFLGPEVQCLDLTSFWRGMGVINMLTDLALILFPVHVIVTLQMSMGKKITILTFFGARSIDIIASAVQMIYLYGFSSSNPTRNLWMWTLFTQIIECITILTSCVPYLRPLLESLPSGLYGSDELRRRGTPSELGYSRSKSGSYQLSSNASKTGEGTRHSRKSQTEGGIKRFLPMLSQEKTTHSNSASGLPGGPRRPDGEIDVEITAVNHRPGEDKKWETESTGSHSKILKTTVMSTEWEEAQRKSRDASSDEIEVVK